MVGVIDKFSQIIVAGVIELVAGNLVHCLCGIFRICLELLQNLGFCRCKRTFKAADDDHGNNNILVLITLIGSAQLVGNGPNEIDFRGNINGRVIPHCIDDFLSHL